MFLGILYCFVYTFVFFKTSYIYAQRIDSSLFFYAGFFGAPWKIRDGTMAALATMGVSIHTLGVFDPPATMSFHRLPPCLRRLFRFCFWMAVEYEAVIFLFE